MSHEKGTTSVGARNNTAPGRPTDGPIEAFVSQPNKQQDVELAKALTQNLATDPKLNKLVKDWSDKDKQKVGEASEQFHNVIKPDHNDYCLGMEQQAAEAKLAKDFEKFKTANFKYTAADMTMKALDPVFVTLVELFPSLKKLVESFQGFAKQAGGKVMEPAFQTMHSFAEAIDSKDLLKSLDAVHKEYNFTKPAPVKKEEKSAAQKESSNQRRIEKESGGEAAIT